MCPRLFRILICSGLMVGALAPAPAARAGKAATQELSEEQEKEQDLAHELTDAGTLPAVKMATLSEMMRFSISADMLAADFLVKNPPLEERIVLPNAAEIATFRTFPGGSADPSVPRGFAVKIQDYSLPGPMTAIVSFAATDGRVQIARDYESGSVVGSVELIQDSPPLPGQPPANEEPVRLRISRHAPGENDLNLTLSAGSFIELRRDHPSEIDQYLRPILRQLGQEAAIFAPDSKTMWQILSGDWKPDDALVAKVKAAAAKFGSDSFQEREGATQALEALGEPAALTLMRIDRSTMTAEENSGIDTFLAPYLPLPPADARRLSQDPEFLLDCQYSDDATLRSLAAARLAAVTGKPVPFDPNADAETRAAAVIRARKTSSHLATAPQ